MKGNRNIDAITRIVTELFSNVALLTALTAMLLAQIIKVVYYLIVEKKVNFKHFVEAGGMPSSHASLVCALSMMVGLKEGFDSILFAVVAIFSAIVMYDAIKVRHEEVGHTLIEVSTGGFLGFLIAYFSHLLF